MGSVARKPLFATCEQQRRRSTCVSAHSDHHLCCSLYARILCMYEVNLIITLLNMVTHDNDCQEHSDPSDC